MMLRAEAVTVALDGVEVVGGVGLALEEGEWLGLIGPNGAGKTTLLKAVAGLVPYAGSIRLQGDEVASLGTARSRAPGRDRSSDPGHPARRERPRIRRPRSHAAPRLCG